MHELGVVVEVVKTVEEFALNNGVTKIDTVVLQIGELSSMIPKYVEDCYPVAIDGRELFTDTKLKIERLPANALCGDCRKVYDVVRKQGKCPGCGGENKEVISGREFMVKEIVAC